MRVRKRCREISRLQVLTFYFVQIPRKKAPLAEGRGLGVPPAGDSGGQRLVPDDSDDQIVILD